MKALSKIILSGYILWFSGSDVYTEPPSTTSTINKSQLESLYKKLGSDSYKERHETTKTLINSVNQFDLKDIYHLWKEENLEVRQRAKIISSCLIKDKKDLDMDFLGKLCSHSDPYIRSSAKDFLYEAINFRPEKIIKYPQIDCLPNCNFGFKNDKYNGLNNFVHDYLGKSSSLIIYSEYLGSPYHHNYRVASYLLAVDLKKSGKYNSQEIKEIFELGWRGERNWRKRLGKEDLDKVEKYAPFPLSISKK